ncbi:hypothetical protein D3C86_1221190 [compost metagenome]
MIREDKRYYHKVFCHEKYLQDKEFKQLEREQMDDLVSTIIKVHKLQGRASIPHTFYPFVQDIRNDSQLFGRMDKRYKQGVTYKVIEDTYEYCSDKIEWARGNKEFKNILSELKYCLAIVRNNIENCIREGKKNAQHRADAHLLTSRIESMQQVNKIIEKTQLENSSTNRDEEIDVTTLFD